MDSVKAGINDLKRDLKKKNTANMKLINTQCKNDFELQTIVLEKIEKYKAAKIGFKCASLAVHADEEKKERLSKKRSLEGLEVDWQQPPSGILRRGLVMYRNWNPELVWCLLQFVEPKFRQYDFMPPMVKMNPRSFLCYGWDINVFEMYGHRVAHQDKANGTFLKENFFKWQIFKREFFLMANV